MTGQIPVTAPTPNWRRQLRDVVTGVDELLRLLGLTRSDVGYSKSAHSAFSLKVPREFVRRMQRRNPNDPLLLQVLPRTLEDVSVAGFGPDPVGEQGSGNPQPGIVHKYQGRVLLLVTGACAVNCRYCFRRHFPYAENRISRSEWQQALDYVRGDDTISELILSGGDPLVAGSDQLRELVDQIASIAHVKRLRIHSRMPVVIPDRVTEDLLEALTRPTLKTIMVIHANHANEIDASVSTVVEALRSRGIATLNQAVLLAGVNDNLAAQLDLCERLFEAGVLPYYLHLLDKVQGAAHFDVPEKDASALHAKMRARLPGYLVPRLVREIEGADAKIGIGF